AHLYQSEGEADRLTVAARKRLYEAEAARKRAEDELALSLYEEAWPLLITSFLKYPKFINLQPVQEDAYELNFHYVRLMQRTRAHVFQPLLMAMAQWSVWPHPSWEEWGWVDPSQKLQIHRVRNARGPLDTLQWWHDSPEAPLWRDYLLWWSLGGSTYHGTAF